VIYRLRAAGRCTTQPVTPDDVIFSFDAFKKNSPIQRVLSHIVK